MNLNVYQISSSMANLENLTYFGQKRSLWMFDIMTYQFKMSEDRAPRGWPSHGEYSQPSTKIAYMYQYLPSLFLILKILESLECLEKDPENHQKVESELPIRNFSCNFST